VIVNPPRAILYYVHDPMCSWCWAFRPVWSAVREALPAAVRAVRLLGGLAPDSDSDMPLSMQRYLQRTWRTIEREVPGTRFNHDFWTHCRPRRSTYPACRAVIAAQRQDRGAEEAMILAIQHAYYLQARNPSDRELLVALAGEIGLDSGLFADDLRSAEVERQLQEEIRQARSMGVNSFPSLVLAEGAGLRLIPHDYGDPSRILDQLVR
jgi:putative protein-disulfide isomerase